MKTEIVFYWCILSAVSRSEAFHLSLPRRRAVVFSSSQFLYNNNIETTSIRRLVENSGHDRTVQQHVVNDGNGIEDKETNNLSAAVATAASNCPPPALEWVSIGISAVYLAHFASLYTQLPGLFGATGLLPIAQRMVADNNNLWVLDGVFQSTPELGMEVLAALGIIVSAGQLLWGHRLRHGPVGVLAYGLLWICWHDLVMAGGRFMQYQMDLLLLDAAPLTLLAASGFVPDAAIYGFRWLLARLYIGAGAVKLLSCDDSWRDLTAVHWHFQSQPLPNPVGAWAFVHLPSSVTDVLTWTTLVVEMAAPFLFLAPSALIRKNVFVLHVLLMCGIALFGNFGPLQILLIIIGFALLDDLPIADDSNLASQGNSGQTEPNLSLNATASTLVPSYSAILSLASLVLAAGGAYWAVRDVGATCLNTVGIEPLVYGLVALGAAVALLPLFAGANGRFGTAVTSFIIFAGSASVMAGPLGAIVPEFGLFNFGAIPYGLFATMTGINGRPVAAIEAAQSVEGPWKYIPLLYQVNDPAAPLPLIFPHFPRVDWTLWFLPFGESGVWIARLFQGITVNDPTIVHLLDEPAFLRAFPDEPPAIVRVVPRKYQLDPVRHSWSTRDDPRYEASPVLASYTRGDIATDVKDPSPWPSTPIIRRLADSTRPEYFVWGCLGAAEVSRRIINRIEHERRQANKAK